VLPTTTGAVAPSLTEVPERMMSVGGEFVEIISNPERASVLLTQNVSVMVIVQSG